MKRRHVLAVLGLSFVTLGIYVIYWLYQTRKEVLNYLPDKNAIPKVLILFIPMLAIVAAIIGMIVAAIISYGGDEMTGNVISGICGIVFVVSILASLGISCWWFYKYFKAVEMVTQGNDAMLLYVLWIILTLVGFGPIWVLVVQNDLNKFIDNGYHPLKMPMQPGYPAQQQWQTPTPAPQQPYGPPQPHQAPAQYQYAPPQPYQTPQPPTPVHGHQEHHGHHQAHHSHPEHRAHHEDAQNQPPQQPYQS